MANSTCGTSRLSTFHSLPARSSSSASKPVVEPDLHRLNDWLASWRFGGHWSTELGTELSPAPRPCSILPFPKPGTHLSSSTCGQMRPKLRQGYCRRQPPRNAVWGHRRDWYRRQPRYRWHRRWPHRPFLRIDGSTWRAVRTLRIEMAATYCAPFTFA